MIYLDLFLGFLKVGLFSFGGGYASVALIREEVLSRGWMDDEMVSYMVAVSESTPGPLMVNMATYVGSSKGGILGAAIATLAVVFPAFMIILLLLILLKNLMKSKIFNSVLDGLKSCIIGIILATGVYMISENVGLFGKEIIKVDLQALILTLVLGLVYFGSRKVLKKGISPILLICISAVCGAVVYGFG